MSFRTTEIPHRFTDVLILGSGIAGLSAAIAAARDPKTDVLVVAKGELDENATSWAQGGIACVVEPERTGDSIEQHIADTVSAGHGLVDEKTARIAAIEGVERVRELLDLGVLFDRDDDGKLQFTLEGGHSTSRILHRGDTTGREIERALLETARQLPNLTFLNHTFAVDLLKKDEVVTGAVLFRPRDELEAVWARRTILATGGLGQVYRETTNPDASTGDGVAMAFRAGAVLEDLEFVQFHPTTLYLAGAERFLITEAVRGEGGVLRDGSGDRFMEKFHPKAELAPRDVVSRGIISTMRQRGENKVFLDLSPIPPERTRKRFPRILEILKGFGIDILSQPIPVRPSAHYAIGGLRTDLAGRTSLPGLFAAGEVAATRLHGANRLASNSLLEGLVFGHRAGLQASAEAKTTTVPQPFGVEPERSRQGPGTAVDLGDLSASLKSLLWQKVGLERSGTELALALEQITSWAPYGLDGNYRRVESWTVQNMLLTAYLLAFAAQRRTESRGVHYRIDFPQRDDDRFREHLSLRRDDFL